MKIGIVCPAPAGSQAGNRVSAIRWAAMLRAAGHRVAVLPDFTDQRVDALIALHARKSARSALRFRRRNPRAPLVVVMTGTDLYRDFRKSRLAQRAMDAADALVLLQPAGIAELPRRLRAKAHSIVQSADVVPRRPRRAPRHFDACVIGHLRFEKDPMRLALASRLVDPTVPLRALQAGRALSSRYVRAARAEAIRNPRYRWLGELPQARTHRLLAACDLMVISSRMEGGANVLSEALAAGVPVLASNIPGNIGILGARYPGLYPVGDTRALARALERAATDPKFYDRVYRWCRRLRRLVKPARERRAWAALIRAVGRAKARPLHSP